MEKLEKIDGMLCDLDEGCWSKPCPKTNCIWNINKTEAANCFLLYKHLINEKQHTLYEIASVMRISHTTVKQIENESLKKLKDAPLSSLADQ